MMAWIHSSMGALIGAHCKSKHTAFQLGTVSHAIADSMPHKDFDTPAELAALALTLAYIAARHGFQSSEMYGAIGAVSPDIENALYRIGVVEDMKYPTHTKHWWRIPHGRRTKSVIPQALFAVLCLYLAHRHAQKRGR